MEKGGIRLVCVFVCLFLLLVSEMLSFMCWMLLLLLSVMCVRVKNCTTSRQYTDDSVG